MIVAFAEYIFLFHVAIGWGTRGMNKFMIAE